MTRTLIGLTIAALAVPLIVIVLLSIGNCYYRDGEVRVARKDSFFLAIAVYGGAVFAVLEIAFWVSGTITLALPEVTEHYRFWSIVSILCSATFYGDILYEISGFIRRLEYNRMDGGSINGSRRRRRRHKMTL